MTSLSFDLSHNRRALLANGEAAKVFVSSTFEDLEVERDVLSTHAFPALRTLCERLGTAFSDIDLRWGVTTQESHSHQALSRCFHAIDRCNVFVGILKTRYGCRLSDVIESFEQLPMETREAWPWLRDCLAYSFTELEMMYGVFRRPDTAPFSFFYIYDGNARQETGRSVGTAAPPNDSLRWNTLIKRINESGARVVSTFDSPTTLATKVQEDLGRLFEQYFRLPNVDDKLAYERRQQTSLVERLSRVHVGRERQLNAINRHIGRSKVPVLVAGESGIGKTALLASWIKRTVAKNLQRGIPTDSFWPRLVSLFLPKTRECHFIYRFSTSSSDHSLADLLKGILEELKCQHDLPMSVPENAGHVRVAFEEWLHRLPKDRTIIILIDGMDNLLDAHEACECDWVPRHLPVNVGLVVASAAPNTKSHFLAHRFGVIELQKLNKKHRRRLVRVYLHQEYARKIDPEPLNDLISRSETSNPLLLTIVIDELHQLRSSTMSDAEREKARTLALSNAIERYVPPQGTVRHAFEAVLKRLESDYSDPDTMVPDTLSFLSVSRRGLTEAELLDVATSNGRLPSGKWVPLLHAIRRWLIEHEGKWAILPAALNAVVHQRYLGESEKVNTVRRCLATYFLSRTPTMRVAEELPWQLVKLQDWDRLADVLSDLEFLNATGPSFQLEIKQYWALVTAKTERSVQEVCNSILASPGRFESLVGLVARLAADFGETNDADRLVDLWIKRCSESGDEKSHLEALLLKGNLRLRSHKMSEALHILQEHFTLSAQLHGMEAAQAANLARQAMVLIHLERFEKAWEVLQQVESLQTVIDDFDGLGETYGLQGEILNRGGRQDAALAKFVQQERICKQYVRPDGALAALGNRGIILEQQERPMEALECRREEEKLARRLGDNEALCRSLLAQARLLRQFASTFDYDKAVRTLYECEQLCQVELPHRPELLEATMRELGNLYGKLGKHDRDPEL